MIRLARLLPVLLPALLLLGCEEEVSLVLPLDEPFTLYGALNPLADTQYVRVFPIEPALELGSGERLDAVVTTTDLATGEVTVWNDSLLRLPNGDYGYLYWAPFNPGANRQHQVRVTRSDGAFTHATVTVPALMYPIAQPPIIQTGDVTYPFYYPGAFPHVRKVEIEYVAQWGICSYQIGRYTFPYMDRFQRLYDAHQLNLTLRRDWLALVDTLIDEQRFDPGVGVKLRSVTLRTAVTDEGWNPPGGAFDPEILIEPGLMSNVENGFGFVGSGYSYEGSLEVPDDVKAAAGFRTGEDPCPPPHEPRPDPPQPGAPPGA